MIKVRQGGTTVSLPIRDEEILQMKDKAVEELFSKKEALVKTRLYSSLCGGFYGEGGGYEFFHGYHLKGYERQIQETLAKNWIQNCEGGLAEFLYDSRLQERVVSMYPKVEAWGCSLWGVLEVESLEELEPEVIETLKDEWYGQMTDGWGEGFVQEAVDCDYGCELYVDFGMAGRLGIRTEEELKGKQEQAEVSEISMTLG